MPRCLALLLDSVKSVAALRCKLLARTEESSTGSPIDDDHVYVPGGDPVLTPPPALITKWTPTVAKEERRKFCDHCRIG